MKAEEFIRQQIEAGYTVHFHDNEWWQKMAPFYYRPVLPLRAFAPGSRPKMVRSLLGYSHIVKEEEHANKHWSIMLLQNEKFRDFSIKGLPESKRKRIKKGLRLNEVRRIEDIGPVLEDMRKICIAVAIRTEHGKPPEYYTRSYDKWKKFMTTEFSLPGREWWGTFHEGSLIAYHYAVHIDDTMYHIATKGHADFLDRCPNDALIFTFLDYCRGLEGCEQVHTGDWCKDKPSLNRFKEYFGFERVDLPVYAWRNPLLRFVRGRIEKSE
jgi:hypothetical protein